MNRKWVWYLESKEKEIISYVIKELEKKKMIAKKSTAVEKTETLLKEYNKLNKSVEKLKQQVIKLKKESKALNPMLSKTNRVALKDSDKTYFYTDETLINRINELQQSVIKTQEYISYVDSILNEFEENEYYPIIEEIYFNGLKQEKVAELYGWATGTVSEKKQELLKAMSVMFFPNDFIEELST